MKTLYFCREDAPMLENVSKARTSSEAAILWFLKAHYLEHGTGASKEEILLHATISEATFNRAWPRLRNAGLVVEIKSYAISAEGLTTLKTG